jgi:hypothetical protein
VEEFAVFLAIAVDSVAGMLEGKGPKSSDGAHGGAGGSASV